MSLEKKQIKMSEFLEMINGLDSEQYENLMSELKKDGIDIVDDNYEYSGSDNNVQDYLKEISNYPLLSKEEEIELFKRYKNGDQIARKKLINSNLRLVVWVAKQNDSNITNGVIGMMDLIQEGNRGLMTAIDKFDETLGYKFSTYATWWIRQAMSRYKLNFKEVVRKPVHVGELIRKYDKFVMEFETVNGRIPRENEILQALNISNEQLKNILNAKTGFISLDAPIKNDEDSADTSIIDMLVVENSDQNNLEGKIFVDQFVNRLVESNVLTEDQLDVFLSRVGIKYNNIGSPFPVTLEMLGKKFGVTRERIRQIEAASLKKIRRMAHLFFDPEMAKKLKGNSY